MKNQITLLCICLLIFVIGQAQTTQQRKEMVKAVDPIHEQELKQLILDRSKSNSKEVSDYLTTNPTKAIAKTSDGEFKWLERIDENGNPVYLAPYNFSGAITIGANRLYKDGGLGLDVEGENITAAIWDGGYSLASHLELVDKVVFGEVDIESSNHGTHVGGTIVARGLQRSLKGMSPKGNLISFRFDNDIQEMLEIAEQGYLISNHSYGSLVNNETPVSYYGRYDDSANLFDQITFLYNFFLPVVSAGNDRGSGLNFADEGYDLLTDRSLAKNVITVGAVETVFRYQNPSDVRISDFSSFGPADDGRIKPDIVAKGVGVLSLSNASNDATEIMSGTSMSAPMVTGGLMLLQELFNKNFNSFMKASTIKGLALMTAKEAGNNPGPDYRFGWGLLDVEASAKFILGIQSTSFLDENSLANSDVWTQSFIVNDTSTLSICLSWTDPAGNPLPFETPEDDSTPMLINDLDLKVVDDQGVEYFPYKLDPSKPESAATTGVNNVDNIEIIHIDAPAGNYRVEITHKGELSETQAYSLLVNGATPQTASSSSEEISGLSIFPNPANEFVNITFDATTVSSKVNVQFYNTLGQMVRNESFNNNGRFNQQVNISDLGSGVYFVQISDGNLKSTRKLIIK